MAQTVEISQKHYEQMKKLADDFTLTVEQVCEAVLNYAADCPPEFEEYLKAKQSVI